MPEGLRRRIWQAVVDECHSAYWRSWSHAVCTVGTRLVPGLRGAALTLYDRQRIAYPVAASDDWTEGIEDIHQIVGEGHARDVTALRPHVVVADLAAAYGRWPGFVAAASATGLRSVSSFFVPLDSGVTGSLTLYRTAPGALIEGLASDSLLADVATVALLADIDALNDDTAGVCPTATRTCTSPQACCRFGSGSALRRHSCSFVRTPSRRAKASRAQRDR